MKFQATYRCIATNASLGSFKTLEAHANTWHEAHKKLPRYIYPLGRRYRRISGPVTGD